MSLESAVEAILKRGTAGSAANEVRKQIAIHRSDANFPSNLVYALHSQKVEWSKEPVLGAAILAAEGIYLSILPPEESVAALIALWTTRCAADGHQFGELEELSAKTRSLPSPADGLHQYLSGALNIINPDRLALMEILIRLGELTNRQATAGDAFEFAKLGASLIFERLLSYAQDFQALLKDAALVDQLPNRQLLLPDGCRLVFNRSSECIKVDKSIEDYFEQWLAATPKDPSLPFAVILLALCQSASTDIEKPVKLIDRWSLAALNPITKTKVFNNWELLFRGRDQLKSMLSVNPYPLYAVFGEMFLFMAREPFLILGRVLVVALKRLMFAADTYKSFTLLAISLVQGLYDVAEKISSEEAYKIIELLGQLFGSVKEQGTCQVWQELSETAGKSLQDYTWIIDHLKCAGSNRSDLMTLVVDQDEPLILTPEDPEPFIMPIKCSDRLWQQFNNHRPLLLNFANSLLDGEPGQPGLRNARRSVSDQDRWIVKDLKILTYDLMAVLFRPGNLDQNIIVEAGFVFQYHTILWQPIRFLRIQAPEGGEEWVIKADEPILQHPFGIIFVLSALSALHDLVVPERRAVRGVARQLHPQTGGPATQVTIDENHKTMTKMTRPYWMALGQVGNRVKAMRPETVIEVLQLTGWKELPEPPVNHHDQPWPPGDRWVEKHFQGVGVRCPVGWAYIPGRHYPVALPKTSSVTADSVIVYGHSAVEQFTKLLSLMLINNSIS